MPAPFGPALNGVVAFVDDQGAIRAGLPTETTFQVIVPGPGNDRPVFSPDGTQLAYLHTGALGTADIVVSKPDGTEAHTLNPDGLSSIAYLGWTPDGGSVVVGAAPRKLLAFDATKLAEPALITDQARFTGTVAGLTGFNDHLASLFRPPLGQEIAFIGSGPEGDGLYAMRRDDSSLRPLLTPKTGGVPFVDMGFAEWSPDGTRIAVMLRPPGTPEFATVVYVMNADGSGLERLTQFNDPDWISSENFAAWSPDSSKIAIQHWFNRVNGDVNVRPITIIDVATHEPVELGPISFDGFSSWGWSPDGKSLLTMPHDGSDRVLLVDAAGNGWTETHSTTRRHLAANRGAALILAPLVDRALGHRGRAPCLASNARRPSAAEELGRDRAQDRVDEPRLGPVDDAQVPLRDDRARRWAIDGHRGW